MKSNLMTMKKVLDRAEMQTLFLIEKEQEHLKKYPDNSITKHRLNVLYDEEKQLHDMIFEEEQKIKKEQNNVTHQI